MAKRGYSLSQLECRHKDRKQIGYFREMVTQAVEVMKYYEDDAEMVVEDRTYPITIYVEKCPRCGTILQSDALGGLGVLDYLPKDFVRTAPDPSDIPF